MALIAILASAPIACVAWHPSGQGMDYPERVFLGGLMLLYAVELAIFCVMADREHPMYRVFLAAYAVAAVFISFAWISILSARPTCRMQVEWSAINRQNAPPAATPPNLTLAGE